MGGRAMGAEGVPGLVEGLGWGTGLLVAAAVPLLLIVSTAFLKISVVLTLLRRALGVPEVPPTSVVTGLALLLTVLAMAPVAQQVSVAVGEVSMGASAGELSTALTRASVPVRAFLAKHADADETALFQDIARRQGQLDPAADDLLVALPAFTITELKEAFWAGFLLFLPFLVLDLIVGNVLLATGLTGLSPAAAALPFKLLLFVAADGWSVLARGLVLAYG